MGPKGISVGFTWMNCAELSRTRNKYKKNKYFFLTSLKSNYAICRIASDVSLTGALQVLLLQT